MVVKMGAGAAPSKRVPYQWQVPTARSIPNPLAAADGVAMAVAQSGHPDPIRASMARVYDFGTLLAGRGL
jgi:hypothetical protein